MNAYQGWRSWNAWNVALWIGNDEGLYREACDLIRSYGKRRACAIFCQRHQGEKTPDGATYNPTCVRDAMRYLVEDANG